MANGYSLITVIGLVITLILICNSNNIKEGWHGMPTVIPVINQATVIGNNTVQLPSNSFLNSVRKATEMAPLERTYPTKTQFVSFPSFQANIAPRFNSGSYGANILYNTPPTQFLAVPPTSMPPTSMPYTADVLSEPPKKVNFKNGVEQHGQQLKEGFCSSAGVPSCKQDFQNNNNNKYNNTSGMSSVYEDVGGINNGTDMFQNQIETNFGGEEGGQRIVLNNQLMFAPSKNRLQALGDPIRGDLPIVPCNTGWFQVPAQPSNMLKQGALAMLGGTGGPDTQSGRIASLLYDVSGGLNTTIAGVDYSGGNMIANNITGELMGDSGIRYTAFA